MAISKELLDKLNDSDLALACDYASVYIKIVAAVWDGLADEEVDALVSPLRATLLSVTEVKMIFTDQIKGIRSGELVEDELLEKIRATMERVPEALKADIGRALFDEAVSILAIDKILSGQERSLIRDELAPLLLVSAEDAEAALAKVAAEVEAAKAASAEAAPEAADK